MTRTMRIRTHDQVVVISGKDRGKTGQCSGPTRRRAASTSRV